MILLLSTSDTDLLSARAAQGPVSYRYANPSRLSSTTSRSCWRGPTSSSYASWAVSARGRKGWTRYWPPVGPSSC